MAGLSKGLIEVGISMVLRDQFSANAGKVSSAFTGMMNDMNTWNRGMQQSIGNAFEYGKQMIGGMYGAYKHYASIQDQIFLTAKISGATAKEQQELMKLAQEINERVPLTNLDITSGMKYLAMAGNSVSQIQDMIGPAAELASIFSMPLGGKGGVADMLTNIMATFGIPSNQARDIVDRLGVAVTSANISLTDLAESLKYSGAVFRNSNVDISHAAAAIGVLGNNGIQASSAGTALANMLRYLNLSITGQKIKGGDYLKKLGITREDLVDARGNLRRLDHVIQAITSRTAGLSGTELVEAYYNIFGVRGERAIAALVNSGNQMGDILDKISKSSGFVENTTFERLEQPLGIVEQFISTWDNLVTSVGKGLAMVFNPVLEAITYVFRLVKPLVDNGLGKAIVRFTAVSTIIGVIVNGTRLLVNTFRLINGAAALLTSNTSAASTGMGRINAQAGMLELHLQHIVALMGQYVAMSMAPGTSMVLPGGGKLGRGKTGRVYMNPKGRGGITSPGRYAETLGRGKGKGLGTGSGTGAAGASATSNALGVLSTGAMLFGGVPGLAIGLGITAFMAAMDSYNEAMERNTKATDSNTEALSDSELRSTYEERFLKALKQTILASNEKGNKPVRLDLSINGSPYKEVYEGSPVVLDDYGINNGI